MAWSWDDFTLPFTEEPIDGEISFVKKRVWAFANPRGSNKRLKQKLYNDSLEGKLHLRLSQASMDSLKAKYEGDVGVLHINPRPPYDSGIMMLITVFTAVWSPAVPGESGDIEYDCNMEMVED